MSSWRKLMPTRRSGSGSLLWLHLEGGKDRKLSTQVKAARNCDLGGSRISDSNSADFAIESVSSMHFPVTAES